ncbi:carbohydrate ABC transporter permease [Streptomyces sp. NBRC 109706]|uniref:carbohydrate ABC transporter permease n=1 Tax=Streptomyces sp. NBRC 109706 TaxID=1550035 RepID=UPI00078201E4|nr:carbohydrate ABC transporter permease [Streptomyces sp. NBRC 109706]
MRTLKFERPTPFTYATLIIVSAIALAPFVYMVSISLASGATVDKAAFTLFPTEWNWSNLSDLFTTRLPVGRFMVNSLIIATLSSIGMVLSSTLVGYAFARMRAPGKNFLFFVILATMMLPTQITMIPQFLMFREIGWVNTYLPLIVPNFFASAYNVFLVRQFVSRLPGELDEAAQIDGLGFFGIFRRIMVPMLFPIMVAVFIFTFTWNWGDFMHPLIYLSDQSDYPMALGVQYLVSTGESLQSPPWNTVMAGSLVMTVPMVVLYYLGQRYIYEMNLVGGSAGVK